MPAFIDYTNRKIGRVKILSIYEKRNGGNRWTCLCDCGNKFISWNANFRRGNKFECKKCIIERRRGIDLTGRSFGRWTVLERRIDDLGKTVWHCKCDCGNEGLVSTYALGRKGKSMSCGCLGRKQKSKWSNPSLYPKASGLSNTEFYSVRIQIIHKCYRPEWPTYNLYGAKGITVCDLWRNSASDMYEWAISNGWVEKTCIILKEGKKEFSPDNCQLIHNDEFRSIIGKAGGVKITYKGELLSINDWSKRLNINITTLRKRLKELPSIDEAFETHYRKLVFFNKPEEVKKIIKLYRDGNEISDIAKMYKVTKPCIHYHLKQNNVKLRNWNRHKHIKDEDILHMQSLGMSLNSIGKKFGVSFTCIKNRLNRFNGIPRKR